MFRHGRPVLALALALAGCTERVPLVNGHAEAEAGIEPAPPAPDAAGQPRAMDGGTARRPQDSGPACGEFSETFSPLFEFPELIIALDRSYSMYQLHLGGASSRIQVAQSAVRSLVAKHQGAMQIGYLEFPGRCEPGSCCAGRLVEPLRGNLRSIEQSMRCDAGFACNFIVSEFSDVAVALERAREYYRRQAPDGAPHVLVITDGEPSCAGERTLACERARAEASSLFTKYLAKTHVIAIGEELRSSACLESIAQAGQTARETGPAHGCAADEASLRRLIDEAFTAAAALSCRLTLRNDVNPDRFSVHIEGSLVPRSATEGWSFDPPTQSRNISLKGSYCDRFRDGRVQPNEIKVMVTRC